ncbi:MAG: MFS transporter [Nevskiaceae bacterium]|jgi:MFS family permease|nr:MAG: MFS transporter [Nevskiaceae bacterium]TAM24005.1 MAG: MFS transporter [Nevskiaceae bacterium]
MSTAASHNLDVPGSAVHGADHRVAPGEIAIGVVIGRLSEMFDFFVFGIAAVLVFPSVFFPFVDAQTGTFYAFAVFSLAFVARPLGSLLFRVLHTRYGRGTRLTVALFILGTATAGIAFLPGYATLGEYSILLLGLFRMAQGVGIAGSWDGLPSLLALNAPENRRGWYAMIPQLGGPIGFFIAAGLFAYLISALSPKDFLEWGWRYPFCVAFAINVVALFARLRLVVTPEFTALLQTRELEPSPLADLFRTQRASILLGAFAPLASFALFHLVTVFPLSWVTLFSDQSVIDCLIVQMFGAVLCMVSMLLSGQIADRIGRRATLAVGAGLIALFSLAGLLPAFLHGSVLGALLFVLGGFVLLGFSHAQAAGAINSTFPSRYRYSGAVVTSDLAWLVGAAFAPLVALFIAAHYGVGYVGLYLLSGAVGTLLALGINRNLEMRDD